MATATTRTEAGSWTAADLYRRFGPMPLERFRLDPAPGTATEDDVVLICDREELLYELVDGVLVRKTMGYYESIVAATLIRLLGNFAAGRRRGVVTAPDGMYRLNPGLIRIPDVSFVALDRLPGRRVPRSKVSQIIPDLAVEVLSEGNTRKEMDEKLADYFAAGVRLVWYIDPKKRTARVFTAPDRSRLVREGGSLDGGDVLPGFALPLRDLFAEPADG